MRGLCVIALAVVWLEVAVRPLLITIESIIVSIWLLVGRWCFYGRHIALCTCCLPWWTVQCPVGRSKRSCRSDTGGCGAPTRAETLLILCSGCSCARSSALILNELVFFEFAIVAWHSTVDGARLVFLWNSLKSDANSDRRCCTYLVYLSKSQFIAMQQLTFLNLGMIFDYSRWLQ